MGPRDSEDIGRRPWCLVILLLSAAACGRIGFDGTPLSDDAGDVLDADAAQPVDAATAVTDATPAIDADLGTIIPIAGSGLWQGNSELARSLVTSTSTRRFTFSSWYLSSNMGTMMLGAGVTESEQSFLWASSMDGRLFFQHQSSQSSYVAAPDAGEPWPYSGQWVHIVIAVDLDKPTLEERVRYFVNGVHTANLEFETPFPQSLDLYLGGAVQHSLGNKHDGAFDWTGNLAETYIIWGVSIGASAFVRRDHNEELRSIQYTGPVTSESVYFNYALSETGTNAFTGQPDWTSSYVGRSDSLPY